MNLYIHVPFCRGKCDYCAFYSEPFFDIASWNSYLNKLDRDLASWAYREKPLETLYIGGGTPTLPDAEELKRFFAILRSRVSLTQDAEISMECNPETMTEEKADLLASFVNRISMGAQSFSSALLAGIGRTSQNPSAVGRTFHLLRKAGLRNIGLDLMYALPGEDFSLLKQDLDSALELEPAHISAYSLTLEEGTVLASGHNLSVPSEECAAEMWEMIGTVLSATHPRYEISNYARPELECRHNQAVWHGEPYFGFGPAASSFDGTDRRTEIADLSRWLGGTPPEVDKIPREERLAEIFMMGLRTVRGWTRTEFITVTASDISVLEPKIRSLCERGLLEESGDIIRATQAGLPFWNEIAEELL